MRKRSLGAIALGVTLLLSGCGGAAVATSNGATAVVGAPTDQGGDVLLQGVAVVDESGCWAILGKDSEVHHAFWPMGSRLDEDGLHVPGSETPIVVGDDLDAGGGESAGGKLPALDHDCWTADDVVFVISNASIVG